MKSPKKHRRPAHILALESSRAGSHTAEVRSGAQASYDPRVIAYRDAGTWITGRYTPFVRVEVVTALNSKGEAFQYSMAMI
jgi:hypothetical protein